MLDSLFDSTKVRKTYELKFEEVRESQRDATNWLTNDLRKRGLECSGPGMQKLTEHLVGQIKERSDLYFEALFEAIDEHKAIDEKLSSELFNLMANFIKSEKAVAASSISQRCARCNMIEMANEFSRGLALEMTRVEGLVTNKIELRIDEVNKLIKAQEEAGSENRLPTKTFGQPIKWIFSGIGTALLILIVTRISENQDGKGSTSAENDVSAKDVSSRQVDSVATAHVSGSSNTPAKSIETHFEIGAGKIYHVNHEGQRRVWFNNTGPIIYYKEAEICSSNRKLAVLYRDQYHYYIKVVNADGTHSQDWKIDTYSKYPPSPRNLTWITEDKLRIFLSSINHPFKIESFKVSSNGTYELLLDDFNFLIAVQRFR